MINLKKIGAGLLVLGAMTGFVLLNQAQDKSYAANTIFASNEVITIGGTTDGQPLNAGINLILTSRDGNVLVFTSAATNVPSWTASTGLYAYNIKTNSLSRVDLSTSGVVSNGSILNGQSVSETGRYITFASSATNLIDGTTTSSGQFNIFLRDLQTGTTTSLYSEYNQNSYEKSERHLGISSDGRFLLWASRYIHDAPGDPYSIVYGDRASGAVSWATLGTGTDSASAGDTAWNIAGQMSCDGSLVAYQHRGLIKIADTRNGAVTQVALTGYTSQNPVMSCNGRYVLYATINRADITPTPAGMNGNYHLVRYDRVTGERSYIDSNSSGSFSTSSVQWQATYPNYFNASVADTGDVVLKYNGYMYLKHLSDGSGTLEPIAKNTSGVTVNMSNGSISADGRHIIYMADPYTLGLASSPSVIQPIRVKSGI